jgi:hypothetical protein
MIIKLKQNLAQAQSRIKKYADKKRVDREFIVGAVVYLKLQPYRHTAFGLHQNLKLKTKYYGPFRVMERIGPSAYKLQLPASVAIQPVFHVSQLKQHIGPKALPQANVPLGTPEGYIKIAPSSVLDTRALPRNDEIVTQWKILWANLDSSQATWEDKFFIKSAFPEFYTKTIQEWWPNKTSCGQEQSQGGGGGLSEP